MTTPFFYDYDMDDNSDEELDLDSLEIDYPEEEDSESEFEFQYEVVPDDLKVKLDYWRRLLEEYSKEADIKELPNYTRQNPRQDIRTDECCICFEKLCRTKCCYCAYGCGTVFHSSCISMVKQDTCPICRKRAHYCHLEQKLENKNTYRRGINILK